MRSTRRIRAGSFIGAALLALVMVTSVSATTWFSGQRNHAGASVEPAVNLANGSEIFLLTPIHAKTLANPRAHAPLYLVLYPGTSTIPASSLNCTPTNCDHANAFPPYGAAGLKGHDHLVGMPHTGDFNIAWDVYPVFFTPQGFADGAINHRILTATDLWAAIHSGNAAMGGILLSFNCNPVPVTTYLLGTPVSL
jgi:hypothetical protein